MSQSDQRHSLAAPASPVRPVPSDDFSRTIGAHLYENQRKIWPHLPDLVLPKPAGYVPTPIPTERANPFLAFQPKRARRACLGKEAIKAYDAISFAMRHHGVVMNTHITIVWRMMGVEDHGHATRLLTAFNHEARKWLVVGTPNGPRQRPTKRAGLGGSPYMYVYVHENSRDQRFHTHQLTFIPHEKAALFNEWALACFARLCRRPRLGDRAICVRVHKPRNEGDAVARCWDWYRYITKSLHPNCGAFDDDGQWQSIRSIFKPYPFIEAEPVHSTQLASGSRNIWTKAQQAKGFWSRFHTGEWDRLYDGWELEARRSEAEGAARNEMLKTLNL